MLRTTAHALFTRSSTTQLSVRSASHLVKLKPLKRFPLPTSIKLVQAFANNNFDETVTVSVQTGLDPRKPNQSVRASCILPHGTGKTVKVAVFAEGDKAIEAKEAGAYRVGGEELIEEIKAGTIDCQRYIATPNMMPLVSKVARILGPRGLMPNPKQGTMTMDVKAAINNAQAGEVQFRTDSRGQLLAPVGKASFSAQQLEENITAIIDEWLRLKPSGAKGTYIRASSVAATNGIGVSLDLSVAPFTK